MPWLSRKRYNSLCRAAGQRLMGDGINAVNDRYNETGMLLWRLSGKKHIGRHELLPMPFEYVHAMDVGEKFIVFVVHNGQGVILEDSRELYPSDELVTKLRMIQQ